MDHVHITEIGQALEMPVHRRQADRFSLLAQDGIYVLGAAESLGRGQGVPNDTALAGLATTGRGGGHALSLDDNHYHFEELR